MALWFVFWLSACFWFATLRWCCLNSGNLSLALLWFNTMQVLCVYLCCFAVTLVCVLTLAFTLFVFCLLHFAFCVASFGYFDCT